MYLTESDYRVCFFLIVIAPFQWFIRSIIEFIDLIKRTDRTNEGTLSILDMIIMFVEIIFIYRLLTSEVTKAVNAF